VFKGFLSPGIHILELMITLINTYYISCYYTPFLLYFHLKNVSHLHQSVGVNVCKLSGVVDILQVEHRRHVCIIERRPFKFCLIEVANEFRHVDFRKIIAGEFVKFLQELCECKHYATKKKTSMVDVR